MMIFTLLDSADSCSALILARNSQRHPQRRRNRFPVWPGTPGGCEPQIPERCQSCQLFGSTRRDAFAWVSRAPRHEAGGQAPALCRPRTRRTVDSGCLHGHDRQQRPGLPTGVRLIGCPPCEGTVHQRPGGCDRALVAAAPCPVHVDGPARAPAGRTGTNPECFSQIL